MFEPGGPLSVSVPASRMDNATGVPGVEGVEGVPVTLVTWQAAGVVEVCDPEAAEASWNPVIFRNSPLAKPVLMVPTGAGAVIVPCETLKAPKVSDPP